MYGALWRALPGPTVVRALILLVLLAGLVFALFEWVYPWINDLLMFDDLHFYENGQVVPGQ